jgi:hypothetical protein
VGIRFWFVRKKINGIFKEELEDRRNLMIKASSSPEMRGKREEWRLERNQ